MNPVVVNFILLPLAIFFSRILDVTIGTLRIILLSKGNRMYVPILGFFEVLLWLVVMVHVVKSLDHPIYYIAYAGGFAAGNYIGMYIENRLAMGVSMIRVVTALEAHELVIFLRQAGYSVTDVPAQGNRGEVHILFTVARRKEINNIVDIIKRFNPNAFYTIEDVRFVSASYGLAMPKKRQAFRRIPLVKKK